MTNLDLYLVQIVRRVAHHESNEETWPLGAYIHWEPGNRHDDWITGYWCASKTASQIFETPDEAKKCAFEVFCDSGGGVICDVIRFMRL